MITRKVLPIFRGTNGLNTDPQLWDYGRCTTCVSKGPFAKGEDHWKGITMGAPRVQIPHARQGVLLGLAVATPSRNGRSTPREGDYSRHTTGTDCHTHHRKKGTVVEDGEVEDGDDRRRVEENSIQFGVRLAQYETSQ